MNIILLKPEEIDGNDSVVLSDQRFNHIKTIHQSVAGDSVRIGKLNGKIGTGTITFIDEHGVTMDVCFDQTPPKKLPLTVILALPRPKMIRRIFRSISELGVSELIVINSYKVEKSFWNSPILEDEKIEEYLIAGLQQAKDTIMPTVSFKRLFKPFVEDELPGIIANTQALIAHPNTGDPCPANLNQSVTLAIGPEGGFTDYEVNKFFEAGFKSIHLGSRILRVENALTALTSRLFSPY